MPILKFAAKHQWNMIKHGIPDKIIQDPVQVRWPQVIRTSCPRSNFCAKLKSDCCHPIFIKINCPIFLERSLISKTKVTKWSELVLFVWNTQYWTPLGLLLLLLDTTTFTTTTNKPTAFTIAIYLPKVWILWRHKSLNWSKDVGWGWGVLGWRRLCRNYSSTPGAT